MSANALLALMGEESKVKTTGDTSLDDETFKCIGTKAHLKKLEDDSYVMCGVNNADFTLDSDLIASSTSISDYTEGTVYQIMKGEPLSFFSGLISYSYIGAFAQTKSGETRYSYSSGLLRKRDVTDPVIDERITAISVEFPSTSQGVLCASESGSLYLLPTRFSSTPFASDVLGVTSNPTDLAIKCPLNMGVGCRKLKTMHEGYLYLGEDDVLYSIGNSAIIEGLSSDTTPREICRFVKDFEHLGNSCIVVLTVYGELVYFGKTTSNSVYTYYNMPFGSLPSTDEGDGFFLEGDFVYDTKGRANMTTREDVYGNKIDFAIAQYSSGLYRGCYVGSSGVVLAKGIKKLIVDNYLKIYGLQEYYVSKGYACITQKNELVVFGNTLFTYDDNSFIEDSVDTRFANGSKIIATGVSDAFIVSNSLYYIKDDKTYVIGNNFCDTTGLGQTTSDKTVEDYVLTKYSYAYTNKRPLYFTEPQLFSETPILTCYGGSSYYEYQSETGTTGYTLQQDGTYKYCYYQPGTKKETEITYGEMPIVHLT